MRSPPRTRPARSRLKRSWPAGTGVWVVKTHFWRTALHVDFGDAVEWAAAKLGLKQREGEQRGVAFVHVINVYAMAQGIDHADAAHAEDDLLLEAVVGVAAVEVVGEAAIPGGVLGQVGVQKIDGDDVAGATHHVIAPGAHGDDAVFDGDGDSGSLYLAEIGRLPRLDVLGLPTLLIQALTEVAFAMQQGKGDERGAEVRGGAEGIAG